MILDTAEVASLEADAEATLSDVCVVLTVDRDRDARGNVIEVVVTGPDFACHRTPTTTVEGGREDAGVGAVHVLATTRLLVPNSVAVNPNDRVLIGDTTVMEVISAQEPGTASPLRRLIAVDVP